MTRRLWDIWGGIIITLGFFTLLVCAVLFFEGCAATPRDVVVASVNASADIGTQAEHTIAELDRSEQEWCLASSADAAARGTCIAAVRTRYHALWTAYRDYRAAYFVAAAAVRAYDAEIAAKKTPDVAHIMAVASALADAAVKFETAFEQIKEAR